jgi:GNAT superfamily N-acetyltransferase
MRTRYHALATEDISAFSAFRATPGFTAESVAAQWADGHLVVLDSAGTITARSSLWWRSAPPLPGHRSGVIGHYAAATAAAGCVLLKAACRFLAVHGCTVAVGPMDGSTWRSYRLVTGTSQRPAFFLEPGFPPEGAGHFEASGFGPLARYFSSQTGRLECPLRRAADDRGRRLQPGIALRPLELNEFEAELGRLYPLCLKCFTGNFLFTPISEEEFGALFRPLRPFLVTGLSWVAESHGKAVGFAFAVPDVLQAERGEAIDTVVLKTLAVAPEFRGIGLGHALVAACQSGAVGSGYGYVIHALIREGNLSGRISAHFARPIRSYTLFAKELVRS